MTKSYSQLMKQIDSLTQEAERLKRKEVEGVIDRIKEAIGIYGLTATDLGLAARRGPKPKIDGARKASGPRRKSAGKVKFRDESGNVWGGRGPRPQWLRNALANGRKLEDFAV